MIPRVIGAAVVALAAVLSHSGQALAQSYPAKPIHIVVPFPAGGITDVIGRALGQRLAEDWSTQVIIENRPGGASGQIGTEYVVRAAADGYTLLVTADATFVTAPHTYSKLPYDPLVDLMPITALGISPQALVVHPSLPVNTFAELVALGRNKPGTVNYGTFGIGSSGHLNVVLLEALTGARFTPVHYRGAAPAITDLIGGHIQMLIVSIGLIEQGWQAGQLKVLGFGSATRLPQHPEVPTLAESGLPGYEAGSWYGLAAPKGTPADIVAKLNAQAQRIFNDLDFQKRILAPSFIFPLTSTPDVFAARIRAESEKWGKVIREANIKVE